jgi:hypothetical protein
MKLTSMFCVLFASLALAQPQSPVREESVYSFPSYVVSNDKLELAVAARGGAMLRLLLQGDPEKLSPFGNPEKLTLNPPAGRAPRLLGHFVCVDGFGPVSPEESKAGLSSHGEAHVSPWEIASSGKQGAAATVKFTVKLPWLQEIFTRTITLVDGESVVYADSELESLVAFDRPVNWAEHATIASPFLEPEKNFVDLSSTRSKTRSYAATGADAARRRLASFQDFTWPLAPSKGGGPAIDVRGVPASPNSMDHIATLLDPTRKLAFVTALNPARQYLLGYIFRSQEFPWIQQWMSYEANGWLQRGLEFATQPFDVPRREAIATGTLFDTPMFRWLPAKSKITTRFAMFYTKTPPGMSKIDEVRLEGGKIIVEDRAAGRQVVLAASLPL